MTCWVYQNLLVGDANACTSSLQTTWNNECSSLEGRAQ